MQNESLSTRACASSARTSQNALLKPLFQSGFRLALGNVGRSARSALGCALALFALSGPVTHADTVATDTPPPKSTLNARGGFFGQSFTTATSGPETNITFNFYSNTAATTPTAVGTGFLLSKPYTGTPGTLTTLTSGFIAEATASGGVYSFGSGITLQSGTEYYFYENGTAFATDGVSGDNTSYALMGAGYYARRSTNDFTLFAADSLNFLVTGTPLSSALFWDGRTSNLWTGANWATTASDVQTTTIPSASTDVTFSVTTGAKNENTILGADFTIHSLTVNDPTAVTIGGNNTLTISGASGVTGITVNRGAGLLTINANLTLAGASNTITVNNTAGAVINGSVGGSIGLDKEGTGALTLNGANSYTGNTVVGNGVLFVNGSIASANIYVTPGALLGGHGYIGGNMFSTGVVSPGNSPGKLSLNGNFAQSSTATLVIQIGGVAPAQHDLLAVGGKASLAGTLLLEQYSSFQFEPGDKVTFLTAGGGVSGKFGAVFDPFLSNTLVGLDLVYLSNSVLLEAEQLPFTAIPGETPNQQAVAYALDASLSDRRNASLITHLDNESFDKVLNDLNRISPDELTSIYQIAVSQAKVQTANLQRRLEDVRSGSNGFSAAGLAVNGGAPPQTGSFEVAGLPEPDGKDGKAVFTPAPDNRWGVFVTGTGEWASAGDTSNSHGYDLTNAGFTFGIDYKITEHFVVGLALGYDHSTADLVGNGRVIVDGGKVALYSSYFTGKGFYADLAVQGGYNGYDSHRSALDGSAIGSDNGGELNVLFGTGYDWKIGGLTFGPTGNFEYTYVGINDFEEHGSLAPLDFPNQHQESIRSTFGAKVSYDWKLGGLLIKPELRAGWQHEYGDATFGIDSSFANGAGPDFLVHGPATGRDSLLLSAGVAIQCSERVSTYVYYDGELGRTNYQANSVSGGFRFAF